MVDMMAVEDLDEEVVEESILEIVVEVVGKLDNSIEALPVLGYQVVDSIVGSLEEYMAEESVKVVGAPLLAVHFDIPVELGQQLA